jgi:phage tail sheath gpL-like
MGDTSSAVALNRVSRVIGYSILKGFFQKTSGNLPQTVAILGEANNANQGNFTDGVPVQITSAGQAGVLFGYGSPIHGMCRILFPVNGSSVPANVFVYPQAAASGAVAQTITYTVGGASTSAATGTLQVVLNGRTSVDGSFYNINVTAGQSQASVASAINAAINGVLGAPMSSTVSSNVGTLTAKWKGLTSAECNFYVIDTIGTGFTFTVASGVAGTGTPSISTALNNFGDQWNTVVISGYGLESTTTAALEAFNGITGVQNPTGRWQGIVMKPFVALCGSVASAYTTVTAITNSGSYPTNMTISADPCIGSSGTSYEAAANFAAGWLPILVNAPQNNLAGIYLPDMPLPPASFANPQYSDRDAAVQLGSSTTSISNGQYLVQDFVTTYHPAGENPPIFAKCRDIMVDLNIWYAWKLIVQQSIIDKVIVNDNDIVNAANVIRPKDVKSLLVGMITDLVNRGFIANAAFSIASISVTINQTNPDRLDITWQYQRTGNAAIVAMTATAGFNYGL